MSDDGATHFCSHTTDGTICNPCMGRNTTGESRAEKGRGGIMADEPGDGEWGEMTDELDDRIDEAIEQRAHHVVDANKMVRVEGHVLAGMGWSTARPTEEGTYWYRWNQDDPQPVAASYTQLEIDSGCLPGHGEWSGPIPLPSDAPAQGFYKADEVEALLDEVESTLDVVINLAPDLGKLATVQVLLARLRKERG